MNTQMKGNGEPHNPHNDVKSNAVTTDRDEVSSNDPIGKSNSASATSDEVNPPRRQPPPENSAVRYYKGRVVETVNEYFLNSDLNWVLGVLSRASSDHLSALIEYGDLTDKDTVKDAVSSMFQLTELMAFLGTLYEIKMSIETHSHEATE